MKLFLVDLALLLDSDIVEFDEVDEDVDVDLHLNSPGLCIDREDIRSFNSPNGVSCMIFVSDS